MATDTCDQLTRYRRSYNGKRRRIFKKLAKKLDLPVYDFMLMKWHGPDGTSWRGSCDWTRENYIQVVYGALQGQPESLVDRAQDSLTASEWAELGRIKEHVTEDSRLVHECNREIRASR